MNLMTLWRWLRPYLSTFVRFLHISYLEAKSEHQGTKLGLLWIPASTLIFTVMLALVFRHSDAMSIAEFYLYVLSGYTTWTFIQDTITGSADVIQKKFDFAVHNNLGLLGLFGKLLIDRLLEYGVNTLLLIAVTVLLAPAHLGAGLLMSVVFIPTLLITSLAVAYLVNVMTVFIPDLAALFRTGIRFVFFASPVFWSPVDGAGVRSFLVTYNPVSYFLGMARQVFGVEPFSAITWIVALSISAVLCLASYLAYARSNSIVTNIK